MMTIEKAIHKYITNHLDYFKKWTLEKPFVVSKEENQKIEQLQKIVYKLITHFVENYNKYQELMPLEKESLKILEAHQSKPYRVGTYRTDFVYNESYQHKIIEISCRCSLNGMLTSSIFHKLAIDYYAKNHPDILLAQPYLNIFAHLNKYLEKHHTIYVLKGADTRNESKAFVTIFRDLGKEVFEIHYQEISLHIDKISHAWIITELAFEEILAIPSSIIHQLISYNLFNDLRTVFLIHDKRFFSVIKNNSLLESALSTSEIIFFKQFYVPTYSYTESEAIWKKALTNKNQWVVKPCALGNGTGVVAGITTTQKEWEQLIIKRKVKKLVLQQWVNTKPCKNTILNKTYTDYVVGTYLFFDNHYFGLGPYRTSSLPVSNQIDFRKACGVILK